MATKKKLLQAAAGTAAASGGAGALNVEDVFSTYLYEGTTSTGGGDGSSQTIVNGIDLDGEGGMVWRKARTSATYPSHNLVDTERGVRQTMFPNQNTQQLDRSSTTSFNSDGFTIGDYLNGNEVNNDYVSWTFRKAPKFFDVVTYTGDGNSTKTISHNLGANAGLIIVKRTDTTSNWVTTHFDEGGTGASDKRIFLLNTTDQNNASPTYNGGYIDLQTDSTFTVTEVSNNKDNVNVLNATYVAYLFAHNDGDGEFGPDGDADIIKCGSVSHTQSNGSDSFVDLGFEPQWVMVKRADDTGSWIIYDTMRSFTAKGATSLYLLANSSGAEAEEGLSDGWIALNSTGFTLLDGAWGTGDYIYIAIRRGPMAVPTDATDVFETVVDTTSLGSRINGAMGPVDLTMQTQYTNPIGASYHFTTFDRLRGDKYLATSTTDSEPTGSVYFDTNEGVRNGSWFTSGGLVYNLKRAPNYFDAVAFTSASSGATTVNHNLSVAPEMIWVKRRDSATSNWRVYHSGLSDPNNQLLRLNGTNAVATSTGKWATTDTTFTINDDNSSPFIAYLFASLDGVSKVGSYSGNSTSGRIIDCGFTTGARFIILKQVNNTSNWIVFDTVRGITTGDDPYFKLDVPDAQTTNPIVDPYSGGFKLQSTIFNASGDDYIFYAIA